MKKYLTDIARANIFLEAAVTRCLFRTNNLCDVNCRAREYCEPGAHGLQDVGDIREYGRRGAD